MDTNVRSGFVSQVKKGYMKRAKDREGRRSRRVRTVMRMEHIRLMIKMYYRKPARKVSALDRRFLVQQLFLYFGMRRYDDIKEITYGDVKVLDEGITGVPGLQQFKIWEFSNGLDLKLIWANILTWVSFLCVFM